MPDVSSLPVRTRGSYIVAAASGAPINRPPTMAGAPVAISQRNPIIVSVRNRGESGTAFLDELSRMVADGPRLLFDPLGLPSTDIAGFSSGAADQPDQLAEDGYDYALFRDGLALIGSPPPREILDVLVCTPTKGSSNFRVVRTSPGENPRRSARSRRGQDPPERRSLESPQFGALEYASLIANTVKHGHGRSARKLFAKRPDLFPKSFTRVTLKS
jgi:hypothetical protein